MSEREFRDGRMGRMVSWIRTSQFQLSEVPQEEIEEGVIRTGWLVGLVDKALETIIVHKCPEYFDFYVLDSDLFVLDQQMDSIVPPTAVFASLDNSYTFTSEEYEPDDGIESGRINCEHVGTKFTFYLSKKSWEPIESSGIPSLSQYTKNIAKKIIEKEDHMFAYVPGGGWYVFLMWIFLKMESFGNELQLVTPATRPQVFDRMINNYFRHGGPNGIADATKFGRIVRRYVEGKENNPRHNLLLLQFTQYSKIDISKDLAGALFDGMRNWANAVLTSMEILEPPKAVRFDLASFLKMPSKSKLDPMKQSDLDFSNSAFEGYAAVSPLMREVVATALASSMSPYAQLIEGETGTGKTDLAKRIHKAGFGDDKPFISVDCGMLFDENYLHAFLGWNNNSFTGAKENPGSIALADGGTLFLDEIGNAPPMVQENLLTIVERGEYTPLGAAKPFKANIRIIAATNEDLLKQVSQGKFRRDLYSRLAQLHPICLPPLRERVEDIEIISNVLLKKIADDHINFIGYYKKELSGGALKILRSYHWPNNVRDLLSVLSRCCVYSDSLSHTICEGDVLRSLPSDPQRIDTEWPQQLGDGFDLEKQIELFKQKCIEQAMRQCRHSESGKPVLVDAAKLLGINRLKLSRELKKINHNRETR